MIDKFLEGRTFAFIDRHKPVLKDYEKFLKSHEKITVTVKEGVVHCKDSRVKIVDYDLN